MGNIRVKMQEQHELNELRMRELIEALGRFEQDFLSIPDVDETLIKSTSKGGRIRYVDDDVEMMWYWFKRGAGL